MSTAALEHFSRQSQLVAVFVGGSREILFSLIGGELLDVSRGDVHLVCDAFLPARDRMIVLCDDAELAASLLAQAKPFGVTCQALSPDGQTPAGFEWLDPAVLRAHGHPAVTRSNTGAQFAAGLSLTRSRRVPLWAERRPCLWLGPSMLLFAIDGGVLAGTITLAVACSEWLVSILGPRRRAKLGRAILRAPRSAASSAGLDPVQLQRRARSACWLVAVLAVALVAVRHYEALRDAQVLTVAVLLALLGALVLATESLVTAVLVAVKWKVDWDFRITVFRRNSTAFGYAHKKMVLATCGRYGQVASLFDYSLEATTRGYGEWREEHEGTWFRVFSEVWTPLIPDVFLRDWRLQVISELAASDVAVFDWAEEVTDNMRWELLIATQLLHSSRILVVYGSTHAAAVERFLATVNARCDAPISATLLPREPDDQYIWPNNERFATGFREALDRLLRNLSEQPRPLGSLVTERSPDIVLRTLSRTEPVTGGQMPAC